MQNIWRSSCRPHFRQPLLLLALIAPALTLPLDGARATQQLNAAKAEQKHQKKTPKTDQTRQTDVKNAPKNDAENTPPMTMDAFLDRLMIAESGGNNTAKNPLSTATGAFQFIESTFISVMRRHFPKRVENLSIPQILALRTDREISRDAARAFTKDNATYLAAAGHKATFPHLRLAFLMGAGGAIQILNANPDTPLSGLVGRGVIRANPWMARLTASRLITRAARDLSLKPTAIAGVAPRRDPKTGKLLLPAPIATAPRIKVRCNLARPSCRRWLALKRRRLNADKRVAESRR